MSSLSIHGETGAGFDECIPWSSVGRIGASSTLIMIIIDASPTKRHNSITSSSVLLHQLNAGALCIKVTLLTSPHTSLCLADLKLSGEEVIVLPILHQIAAPCSFAIVRCRKLLDPPFSKATGDGNLPILKAWSFDHAS